ncbi:MAG: nitrate reductase [Sulfobacillus thermosulfidooxidans]|uniref:Nitrate reductase n=1 Tax=Sulfobacillus thermosulfidooxidans TaxID=28034 RepID=A0A2T2WRY5_SULTH|nr:MAG: nitrate reductase [Sulfobacillus thermosulfidooxidans]
MAAMENDSRLMNPDLLPVPAEKQTWNMYNYAALWIGMSHNVATYLLAAGFIALGMTWWEAILTIVLGNLIVLIPILLNSNPGTKYRIPFPVLARASFGVYGATIPSILRGLVAAGWFGINAAIGGSAVNSLFGLIIPGWNHWAQHGTFVGLTLGGWIAFLLFWFLNVWVIYHGMDAVRRFENWAGPLVLILGLLLLFWAHHAAHGWGPMINEKGSLHTFSQFFVVFIPSLTGVIAFWSTLSLNIPDFTRFSRSQKDQLWGQTLGLPTTMTLFSLIGILVTSASIVIYGKAIWDPVSLIMMFKNPLTEVIGLGAVIIATLSVNVAANIVAPAYDLSQIFPRMTFERGGLITAIIGILMFPWLLLSNPHIYIFSWLGIYSGFLGPIAAILIADYWVYRKKILNVADLYHTHGDYTYTGGYNLNGMIALAAGILIALIGLAVPALKWLFSYAWFSGFAASFIVYLILMNRSQASLATTESTPVIALDRGGQ